MVTVGAYVDLEAALENSDYTPSFAPRAATKKPIGRPQSVEPAPSLSHKNSSNAPSILEEEPIAPRRTLMGLHKASSIEGRPPERPTTAAVDRPSTSAATKNKDWDLPLPDIQARPSTQAEKLAPPPLLMEEPMSGGYMQRGMKPPLSRKGSDKAFTTTNDQPTKQGFFQPPTTTSPSVSPTVDLGKTLKMNDGDLSKLRQLYEEQNKSLKVFYEKQITSEKAVLESRMKQLRQNFDKEKASREIVHKEELAGKLSLKELEIGKLREIHKMEMESKNEQVKQLQTLHEATSRAQRKTDIVEQWELKLKEQNSTMSQLLATKQQERVDKLNRQLAAREERVGKREQEHEQKQKEWRDSSRKEKENLEKEYERLQTLQETILRKQKQLERDYQLKKEQLSASIDEQRRGYERKSQDLEILRAAMEHQKKLSEESRQHYQKKLQQSVEERQELLRQCDQQKRSAVQKQIDLENKLKVLVLRQAELDCLKEEVKGKTQLLQLQRRRLAAELSSAQRPQQSKERVLKTYLKEEQRPFAEVGYQPSLKKTLTELKNTYLEGLQHIRNPVLPEPKQQGDIQPRAFTFNKFYSGS